MSVFTRLLTGWRFIEHTIGIKYITDLIQFRTLLKALTYIIWVTIFIGHFCDRRRYYQSIA